MAISGIAGVSNATLWNLARKEDPTFRSHTAKATSDLFTERGFEAIQREGVSLINEWFNVSLRIAFQMLNVATAKNPLADAGLIEVYDTPNGGYVQRMALNAIKPVSPAYKGLSNGDSPDPFIVRKPDLSERFFAQNFDFQNFITNQDFQIKTIFISEYGMGQILAGILEGLQASYIKQEYYNALECLNAGLNSETHPLKDSQVIRLTFWEAEVPGQPDASELKEFIKIGKNIARHMKSVASTSEYNAASFDSITNPEDYVMLVRPNVITEIETMNALNAPGNTSIPFEIHEVENFGGLVPMIDIEVEGESTPTVLYPVYDSLGVCVGYSADEDAETATYEDDDIYWLDPNSDVLAVIAERGLIFENAQNPYTVEPIRNPRGMYDNFWANRPNNSIVYDYYKNVIIIAKPLSGD